jgi:hypothetical protein
VTPHPSPADIEGTLLEILRENRPGKQVRGCASHLEIYDREVQGRILAPLLRARAEAGLIGPLDDLGHDTPFTAAWNRAIRGESEDWDCRSLALPFVRAAVRSVPDFFEKVFAERFDEIDDALLRHLPDILAGPGLEAPATCEGLKSWVDSGHVWFRFDGMSPSFCEKDGSPLREPPALPAYADRIVEGPTRYTGLMSFHGSGVTYEEGQKAWTAWREAADAHNLLARGGYDSMLGMTLKHLRSRQAMGIHWMSLRQDEWVSLERREDGFVAYRGTVEGLEQIVDEGMLLVGETGAFLRIFQSGGIEEAEAEDYLRRLAESGSAFTAEVPAGSVERGLVDPELLLGEDIGDPDEMAHATRVEDAVPIFAAGTFPMPLMRSWRERRAAEKAATLEDPSP